VGKKLCECIERDGTHRAWLFRCPGCDAPHQVDDRWTFNGDQEKPTFRNSVLLHEDRAHGYRCHSYVTDGRIQFLPDSTHALKGQTVDLPDWDGWRNG
jgi:hypothetical protein